MVKNATEAGLVLSVVNMLIRREVDIKSADEVEREIVKYFGEDATVLADQAVAAVQVRIQNEILRRKRARKQAAQQRGQRQ